MRIFVEKKRNMNLICLIASAIIGTVTAQDGDTLKALWEKWENARKADKPQTEAQILTQILEEAETSRRSVDFYNAAKEYVDAVARHNWKQRESAQEEMSQRVRRFAEPIVTFKWMDSRESTSNDALAAFADKAGFVGRNPSFYTNLGGLLKGTMAEFIRDDSEYVRWRLLLRGCTGAEERLREKIGTGYPQEAALDLYNIQKLNADEAGAGYLAYGKKYRGRAAAFIADEWLLQERFQKIKANDEEAYLKLHKDCLEKEKARGGYKGQDAIVAKKVTGIKGIIEALRSEDLDLRIREGKIELLMRNFPKAGVELLPEGSSAALHSWEAVDTLARFYVTDTVSIALPKLSDGDYKIKAGRGKTVFTRDYRQYTLSIACSRDSRGPLVYVCRYDSGKPLEAATVKLSRNGKTLASARMVLDGFTPLPSSLTRLIKKGHGYALEAEDGDCLSLPADIPAELGGSTYSPGNGLKGNLYLDRGAFKPGDKLKFKLVLYSGDPSRKMKVEEGKKVNVKLLDTEGKTVGSMGLKTNSFGSASGEFTIPEGLRNGWFSLEAACGRDAVAYKNFRVEEYVLPSFRIDFDRQGKVFAAGDDVPVSGTVTSYSGHSLTGARASVSVEGWDYTFNAIGTVDAEGKFRFTLPKISRGYHRVTVKVTTPGGETLEESTRVCISGYLSVDISVSGSAPGEFSTAAEQDGFRHWGWRTQKFIITDDSAKIGLSVLNDSGEAVPVTPEYTLLLNGKAACSGKGQQVCIEGLPDGLYTLEVKADAGKDVKGDAKASILLLRPGNKRIPEGVERVIVYGDTIRFGNGIGALHSRIMIHGEKRELLEESALDAEAGEMAELTLPYPDAWPDAVNLNIFYFTAGKAVSYSRQLRRPVSKTSLPLQFTRFHGNAFPGQEYLFEIKTLPETEALVAVWDKSLDAIARNDWEKVWVRNFSVPGVYIDYACGKVGENERIRLYKDASVSLMATRSAVNEAMSAEEELIMDAAAPEEEVPVRSEILDALAFHPHIVSGADGRASFSVRTSDKLSTYYIRVYAHDKSMHNSIIEDEMLVTIPVQVSVLKPEYLYLGDSWKAAVTVSSIAKAPVSGTLKLALDGKLLPGAKEITVAPGSSVTVHIPVTPEREGKSILTAYFAGDAFTDAVRVSFPVYEAAQELTESHSAVLLHGMSRDSLERELRGRFVNVPGESAAVREISVLDMVKDVASKHAVPRGKDVLSLSEALYVNTAGGHPADSLLASVMACRCQDGGFAWFPEMESSPVITAVLLERFAAMERYGLHVEGLDGAVRYLDRSHFGKRVWWSCLSDEQYIYIRSMYADVPFEWGNTPKNLIADFRKMARAYLVPSAKEGRGLQGQILAKARRLLSLKALTTEDGLALAKAWGVGLRASAKLKKSIDADVSSLLEYAVKHPDGGYYYPNAVMPWRGLMESEAYAHALLCRLLSDVSEDTVADGIRLWLLLQKETQNWEAEPAFVDAVQAILEGSENLLDTKVMELSGTSRLPFAQVQASANGFTIERIFQKADGTPLTEGDSVHVGDKIVALYRIWSAQNRSFVRLTAPREATLRPVVQTSGYSGAGGYRNVRVGASEYFREYFPEETTVIREEFFVTQEGRFAAPVPVIESLYAPHYRANTAFPGPLTADTGQ